MSAALPQTSRRKAKALPVIRCAVRCTGGDTKLLSALGAPSAAPRSSGRCFAEALSESIDDSVGGIRLHSNPRRDEGEQQLGVSLSVEDCLVAVSYINARAGCWEPFVEPWTFDISFSTLAGATSASADAAGLGEARAGDFAAEQELTLVSLSSLQVNVTPQMCALGRWLLENREHYLSRFRGRGDAAAGAGDATGGARYRLLNMTGAELQLAMFRPSARACAQACELEIAGVVGELAWRVFGPSDCEASLDALLGDRSAEDWRTESDRAWACAVRFCGPEAAGRGRGDVQAHASWPEARQEASEEVVVMQSMPGSVMELTPLGHRGTKREASELRSARRSGVAHFLLSSTCSGLLPVPPDRMRAGISEQAVCEVLAPHPSHHLMLVSSRTRVFNHTDQELEVCFSTELPGLPGSRAPMLPRAPGGGGLGGGFPSAVSFDVFPEAMVFPREIETSLRRLGRPGATEQSGPEPLRERSVVGATTLSQLELQEDPGVGCQLLPPQHFICAPLGEGLGQVLFVQFRLPGARRWSDLLPLTATPKPQAQAAPPRVDRSVTASSLLPRLAHSHLSRRRGPGPARSRRGRSPVSAPTPCLQAGAPSSCPPRARRCT